MTTRVLVAEDNEDHLFLTVRALRDSDGVVLEVEAVRDGAEALDFLHQRGGFADRRLPHLILLDLKMPKVSGLEVLAEIKSVEGLRSIPVVVLTSSDRHEDIEDAYRLGSNSYVTKPVGLGGLRSALAGIKEYWVSLAALPEPRA